MANGGSFIILTNDGKQDDMLMASRFLAVRLQKIQDMRAVDPKVQDATPTLVDIEKTHHLFVNAHFKPFVALAYEYQVTTSTGQPNLGSNVQFSIPLYGDFIHDMTVHIKLNAVSATNTNNANKFIRYVDYPGERILKEVKFSVNGNDLDRYESDCYPFHREFCVKKGKRLGYDRLMGQQVPVVATSNVAAGRGAGTQQKIEICDGHQTPKTSQGELDLWIPLLFWYSLDPRLSLVSVAIPYGQRFINLQLAQANELLQHVGLDQSFDSPSTAPVPTPTISTCELFINNIFCNPEIHAVIVKRIGFSLIRVHRIQKQNIQKPEDRILMSQFKWPVETIYLGARPSANNDVNNSKMLDNWHKFSTQTLKNVNSGFADTNQLILGALANNPGQAADYTAAFTRVDGRATNLNFATELTVAGTAVLSVAQINQVLTNNGYRPLVGTFVNVLAPTNAEVLAAMPVGSLITYTTCSSDLTSLQVEAHGVQLYKEYSTKFYNSYIPTHFGGDNIMTPEDCGKFMITFGLFPGTYQPNGHINISRAREFYIIYKSNTIGPNYTADMYFIAVALNFLLISDGSAVLRYST